MPTIESSWVLALGLASIALAIGVVLSHSPITVVGSNHVSRAGIEAEVTSASGDCQAGGSIPRGTSAIRISLSADIGPKIKVRVVSGSRVIDSGERAGGWGIDETVTVPIRALTRAVNGAFVCTSIGKPIEGLQVNGTPPSTVLPNDDDIEGVQLRFEYLRVGRRSWLSELSMIAWQLDRGRAVGGPWLVLLVLAGMLAMLLLACRLVLRELR